LILVATVIGVVAISAFGRWVKRRWDNVDDYYEREHKDPPIFDAGDWLGGGRL